MAISSYFSPASVSFPSSLTSTFYWTVTNPVPGTPVSVSVTDGNGSSLYSNSVLTAVPGVQNTGSLTFNNPGTGVGTASLPTYSRTSTTNITISPPAGISINNYPTQTYYGTPFSYDISGGYPNETWTANWSGAFSGTAGGSLNSSGTASYSTGTFGTNYGTVTITWTFSRSSQTPSKTVTNNPSGISISYPTTAIHGTGFTWSLSGGWPGETASVSWTGAASGSTNATLNSSGNYNNGGTGDFGTNYGSITVTWNFSQSTAYNGTTRSITNYAPAPTINYPASVSGHGPSATFTWSVSGIPNESFTVSFRGANTGGPYTISLDSSGNFSNSAAYFTNAGTTYLDWSFASTSRQNAPYTTTTTTVGA